MDAGVVSGLGRRRSLRERRPKELKRELGPRGLFKVSRLPVAERPPAAESRAGPSAASALLSDAPRHRPRRPSLHPAPRRSQRRLTPFFSSLLAKLLHVEAVRFRLREKGAVGRPQPILVPAQEDTLAAV